MLKIDGNMMKEDRLQLEIIKTLQVLKEKKK